MADIETPDADAAEQEAGLVVGQDPPPDLEAPEADAAEQAALARPTLDPDAGREPTASVEADEADVQEQRAVVDFDDDDYR